MYRDGTARVLLAVSDTGIREAAAAALEETGYEVVRAAHPTDAIGRVYASLNPLVVLFGADWLEILNAVLPDRRLGRHHAYIVLVSQPGSPMAPGNSLLPHFRLSTLHLPLDRQLLLDMVAWAIHALAADTIAIERTDAVSDG